MLVDLVCHAAADRGVGALHGFVDQTNHALNKIEVGTSESLTIWEP